MIYRNVIESPIDPLTIDSDGEYIVDIWMGEPSIKVETVADPGLAVSRQAREQLDAYFNRELTEFDLPLKPQGTPFQLTVWRALMEIPYGTTISYGELARRVGNPNAQRAVGLANGKNRIPVVIPCHRVIGSNGKLVGFGGGLPRKITLLEIEKGKTLFD